MEKFKELWALYRYQIIVGTAALLAAIALLAYRTVKTAPSSEQAGFSSAASSALVSSDASTVSNRSPARVCVDVKGAVQKPGVYYFKRGARIQEAIRAAGGALPNAAMKDVNLAKELADQQIIYIPAEGEQVANQAPAGTNAADPVTGKAPVNLNTATKEQLCQITGIGDKKADLILEYRQQHGQFKTVDELMQVSGFGEKTVAKIKEQVAV